MPNRIYAVQCAVLTEIEARARAGMERDETVEWEKIHMVSAARAGAQLARGRGVDVELAACACALHDIGRIIFGKQAGHAEAGYAPARELLAALGGFRGDEIEALALAVKNHSAKAEVGGPLEEIVKDADVLDMEYYGRALPREEQRRRLEKLREELRRGNLRGELQRGKGMTT
jgi:uncharacterized protein